ncbi:MAG: hypothetical protein HYR84_07600 [Planctomycetes bacterium]|nr:hypothetical protein [Planctomycetota bacterium]
MQLSHVSGIIPTIPRRGALMKSPALQTIEKELPRLSHHEQLWLIEHLAKHLRRPPPPANFEADLVAMANDPQIQQENRAIEAEFAGAEEDGLEGL